MENQKQRIYEVLQNSNYTGKFEIRLNDLKPKLLFENTLNWDFLESINMVVPIIKIASTQKNSSFFRNFGWGNVVYIDFKKE